MTTFAAPLPLASSPSIRLIYAQAANGVIGHNNRLPWHLPEDMAHFKACTAGCCVIMGRKTWDSLPEAFRPLPGRTNMVVTRQPDWQAPGAHPAASVQEAIDQAIALTAHQPPPRAIWVIGGAQIYAAALALADWVEVTHIDQTFIGDAFAPVLGPEWDVAAKTEHISSKGLPFAFVSYRRKT